jgi:hypothetical protein
LEHTKVPLPTAEHLNERENKASDTDPNVGLWNVPDEDEANENIGDHSNVVQLIGQVNPMSVQ